MSVEQEASSPDRIPRISRPELNKLARRLLLAAQQADRHLDAGRGTLTQPVRELAQSFRELTELIKGGSGAGSPADGATVGDGRRVPPPCVREGASLSQALHDDARHMVRAAKAVAKSLLSRDFTDKALMDAVGEVHPGSPDDEVAYGERFVSAGFDVASYALLDPSDGEAVSRQAVTEATRHSGAGTKVAWSMLQYALGASPLKVGSDFTKVMGEAVRESNAMELKSGIAQLAVLVHPDPVFSFTDLDHVESGLRGLLARSPEPQAPPPPRRRSGRAASRRRRVLASGAPLEPEPIGDRAVPPHDVGGPAIGEPEIRGSELPGPGSWSW
ncbi:hypothetical protein ACFV8Z_09470 [Streptomyces sp. NPDC059837]|uniref:hypothetical protein n=1 Tax=Streptomyces sp. NPDC059837 TaxID=3346968 RepID=UPI00365999CF